MQPDDASRIEQLKKSLYSRTAPDVRTRRKLRFSDEASDIKSGWERPKDETPVPILNQHYEDHSMSFFTKLLIGSVIFCVIAVGIGVYVFLNGGNFLSADNIDITVNGPVSVPGGTPISFDITVMNNNNIDLQLVDLTVNFPAGAVNSSNTSQPLTTYQELLGNIPAGGSAKKTLSAVIFGEENTQKEITVDVTYKVKGSSASFTKEKAYDILINSSPVNITVSTFKEITSGQEFDIKADIKSNSQDVLKGVLVSAAYPFGFTFLSSDIKPLPDNATWRLGDIPPGGERAIAVHGKLQGVDGDNRTFRFTVGAEGVRNKGVIGTEYMSTGQDITIKKPFITVAIALDGDQSQNNHPANFNRPVNAELSWFNNLPSAVSNATIKVKLSGSAYDKTFVQPGSGYFQSATDEIIWDQKTVPQLAQVGAGESGKVSFTVTPRDLSSVGRLVTNPTLILNANVSGQRTQESGVPESLVSAAARKVVISSSISLSGAVLRTSGPFAGMNNGPIPPRSDQKTAYTIVWTVDNTSNPASNAQVTATLPPYVQWMGSTSPATEDISYDQKTGLVVWNVGAVGSYTVNNSRRKEIDFQVSIQPNVNQVGSVPNLIGDATLTGTDDFTGIRLTSTQSYLTTRFSTDPSYKSGDEVVAK